MPNSTKNGQIRPIIINPEGSSEDDSALQLAAMICSLRDMCVTHMAQVTGSTEEKIINELNELYDYYYQSFTEQSHRNN